ncbi:alpha/beta hydrolase [Streptomyces sp. NPDC056987]|uniref:alpha/beta hydrolase n=1 Tax=Streptomyces sp. NPDC056987 TaxID=3345988 RepID=UPI00362BBCFE
MNYLEYAGFLPAEHTKNLVAPTSTWWQWRDTRIHVNRSVAPDAPVRVMIIHGAGGHSQALWPLAAPDASDDLELIAPDLPMYGDTVTPDPAGVRYDDFVDLLCDLVRAERAADPRPILLFGLSMGGMLAYEVSARTRDVAAVLVTNLIDLSDTAMRATAIRYSWMGVTAPYVLPVVASVLGRLRLPARWFEDMDNMSNDPQLSRLCATDPRGGGIHMPLGFLSSIIRYVHTPPQAYRGAPLTLAAPTADLWTPAELNIRFLQKIAGPTDLVMLENCGHFPVEEPGFRKLRATLINVVRSVAPAQ